MGRLKREQEQLFYSFCLEEAVPDDHAVRAIASVLDLSWVHGELAAYYSPLGRPSIDPALMIRMLIVGYVFAIRSERALCPLEDQSWLRTHAAPRSFRRARRVQSRRHRPEPQDARAPNPRAATRSTALIICLRSLTFASVVTTWKSWPIKPLQYQQPADLAASEQSQSVTQPKTLLFRQHRPTPDISPHLILQ